MVILNSDHSEFIMRSLRSAILVIVAFSLLGLAISPGHAQSPPVLLSVSTNLPQVNLSFQPVPAVQAYKFLSGTNLAFPLTPNSNFFPAPYHQSTNVLVHGTNRTTNATADYVWRLTNAPPSSFHRLQVTPMSSNAVLAATVLNRLAYGPTPDELERILTGPGAIGPQAYINEQLLPSSITETVDATHTNLPFIAAKFCQTTNFVTSTNAGMADLRAWHILRAVGARRQLLEILLQFWENHFVTQYSKSVTYFQNYYSDGTIEDRLATQWEFLENQKWRDALLNPPCTFYDLLKISAESPAMIVYLDTVGSKGNGANIANENYARELMELFTMGVDNGYDQNDITVMSRCWTGWSVEKVSLTNAFNPFASATTNIIPGSTNVSTTTKSNLYGSWVFNYKSGNHNLSGKTIFPGKQIPARFGAPYTTRIYSTNTVTPGYYQLFVPGLSGTNGIQEGYQVIQHIAALPFTQEYISIKLCRLFVHDNFPNPSNDTNSPAYAFYNYAAGNLSPEANLVRQCMQAWDNTNPKGQIWAVLATIFNSDLFRSQAAALQKIKTPLEFTVSAVRALCSSTNGNGLAGSFTALSDGYSIGGTSAGAQGPLARMGDMLLFDRDAPNGYPEAGPAWISAGTLAERLRFVQSFCNPLGAPGHVSTTNDAGNSYCDIIGLLRVKVPSGNWNDPNALASYVLSLLYPGEGAGNLQLYQSLAVNFLNTADNGTASSFSSLPVIGTPGTLADYRVRGMVGMLMTLQRFQEQ